ncbi:MAG: hypothetical protein J6S43_02280 [Lentisphaeria bacterium]|nr:hypothetical protein [Lentisphaeria bacterium]
MKILKKIVLFSAVALPLLTLSAAEVVMKKLAPPTLIDGMLEEKCWQDAPSTGEFFNLHTAKAPAEKTVARYFADDKNIYIGFECFFKDYSFKEKEIATVAKEWPIIDHVEVFLDPGSTGVYCHLMLAVNGNTLYQNVSGAVKYGIQLHKDRYTVEIQIPFESLKVAVTGSNIWRMNLCRANRAAKEWSSWAKLEKGTFHDVDSFYRVSGITADLASLFRKQRLGNKMLSLTADRMIYNGVKEMKLSAEINTRKSLKKWFIICRITDRENKKVFDSVRQQPVFFTNDITIPLTGLAPGRYKIHAELFNADGQSVDQNSKSFWIVPPAGRLGKKRLSVKNNNLYLDGEFFFWCGTTKLNVVRKKDAVLWGKKRSWLPQSREEFRDLYKSVLDDYQAAGFNCISDFLSDYHGETEENLLKYGWIRAWERPWFETMRKLNISAGEVNAMFAERGISVMPTCVYLYGDITDEKIDRFVDKMIKFREEDNIQCWHTSDETDGEIEGNLLRHRLYKEIDPSRLTWFNAINGVTQNIDAADIISSDPYPIPVSSVKMVSAHVDRLRKTVEPFPDKACIVYLQNFAGGLNWTRPPTRAEVTAMTFLAMNHGAAGISYFAFYSPEDRDGKKQDPDAFAAMPEITSALKELAPVYRLGKTLTRTMVGDIDLGIFEYQNRVLVSCVNTLPQAVKGVKIPVPVKAGTAAIYRSDRQPEFKNGMLTLDFKPYEVQLIFINK